MPSVGQVRTAFALSLLLCSTAWAKSKPLGEYQDGVLVSFYNVTTGSSCSSSGTVNGKVDDDGKISGSTDGNTNCSNNESRRYKIKVGDNTFVLRRTFTKGQKAGAIASMGWSALFVKNSILADLLPGTAIKVRSDGTGFFVKVGNKESRYDVVAAQ